ncbi:hypothetical protein CSC41_2562 [Pseudomonas aeruginosa]|nr:hypothetical protein CSC41_2562 [Pseudomonas aeruginosa]
MSGLEGMEHWRFEKLRLQQRLCRWSESSIQMRTRPSAYLKLCTD